MNYLGAKTRKKCLQELPLDEFYNCKTTKDGRLHICISCEKFRIREYIKSKGAKEKRRRKLYAIAYKYGLDKRGYEELLKSQEYKCKICGVFHTKAPHGTLCVDHCHKTNTIRGLLCSKCNAALGHFNDNVHVLANAIEYLKEKDHQLPAAGE